MYFTTANFEYDPQKREFFAEASMLTEGGRTGLFRQIHPEAGDLGLTIQSEKTGNPVDYVVMRIDRSGEDVAGWWLEPATWSKSLYPECSNTHVFIIND